MVALVCRSSGSPPAGEPKSRPWGMTSRLPALTMEALLLKGSTMTTDQPTPTGTPPRRDKKLYRDPVDKKIGGVASGVARYFDIDTTLTRAVWVASILLGGFGLVLYLILWLVLEDEPPEGAAPAEEGMDELAPADEEDATGALPGSDDEE